MFQRVKIVGESDTSATIVPQFVGAGNPVCRVFLVENAYPFDTPIEAIRQTGTQYIDTEINPGPTTFASLDFKFDEVMKAQQRVFGCTGGFVFDAYINGASVWASACKDDSGDYIASSLNAAATRLTVSLDANTGNYVIYNPATHATTTKTRSSTRTKTSSKVLTLFACDTASGVNNFAVGGLIYGGVITTNGVPARNFQPCALGSRAGLYDAVSGRIFWSAVANDDFQVGGASVPFAPAEGETQVAVSDALSLTTRAITDVSFSTADSTTTVNVTFEAGSPGDVHALYVAYAPTDMGAQMAGWTAFQRVKIVGENETAATFTLLPQITGGGNTVCRVFLVESAYPFDTLVESIRQSTAKTQYIDTEITPGPKTFAALDFKFNEVSTAQQRVFGNTGDFVFDAYNNSGTPSKWASACKDDSGDYLASSLNAAATRLTISLDANTGNHVICNPATQTATTKTRSNTRTKTSTKTLTLFAYNTASAVNNFAAGGLIYAGAITSNSVPVRTFLPCALGERAGLYDMVSGRIFWSAAANDDFTASGASVPCAPAAEEVQIAVSAMFDVSPATLDISGAPVWGAFDWSTADWRVNGASVAAPTSGSASINVTGSATLTLDTDVALAYLLLNGSGKLVIFTGSHTFSAGNVTAASGVQYVILKGTGDAAAGWTGFAGDGSMANGGNWVGDVAPAVGADLNFSGVSSAATINADANRAFGTATMGGGVITFTNALAVTGFTDRSKLAVGADSTVTIGGNVSLSAAGQRLCNTVAAGGTLRITGAVEFTHPSGEVWVAAVNDTPGAIVVEGGIAVKTSASAVWNVKTLALGASGISFTQDAPFYFTVDDALVYSLGASTVLGTNGKGKFRSAYDDVFLCTTQYGSDQPATITFDGNFNGVNSYWGHWRATGCGRVECTAATKSNRGLRAYGGATLAINPNSNTIGQSDQTFYVYSGGTLEVAASGTVTLTGNLNLADGAALGFNFTDKQTPPALGLSSGKTMTAQGAVTVTVSATGFERPKVGEYVLTTCGGFGAAGVTVSPAADAPNWAKVSVNGDGNIVLGVKPQGTMVVIR